MLKSKRKLGTVLGDGALYFIVIFLMVLAVFPFVYMGILSLMNTTTMKLTLDRIFSADWTIEHYVSLLFGKGKFLRNILNSLLVSVYACSVICFVSSMAAYVFAKKKFAGRDQLFFVFLMTMMIPGQALLIPKFLVARELDILNTYTGLSLPMFGAFGVILIRSFMKGLPDDLFEAADLDGCGEIRKFFTIVLPLAKPAMVSQIIFNFVGVWGELMWPLVASSGDMTTLTQAIANMKNGMNLTNYGHVMAATTIAFLPPFILYLILQKQFVEGIALSGIKG